MKVLMGIGNELGGDDAVGLYVAELIDEKSGWIGFRCGTAPENFIGKIERLDPELVVLVDAAEMETEPGEFRKIEPEYADTIFASTHSIPISYLLKWLRRSVARVILIGIQAKSYNMGAPLSDEVKKGAERLVEALIEGYFVQHAHDCTRR